MNSSSGMPLTDRTICKNYETESRAECQIKITAVFGFHYICKNMQIVKMMNLKAIGMLLEHNYG